MMILFYTILLLAVVLGVKHRAANPEAQLPDCVMNGFSDLVKDIKVVAESFKKASDKAE